MALAVGAAIRVARINRRASGKQRQGLCRSTVVPQLPELGIGVVQIASTVKVAGAIAAQVVAMGGYRAVTVSPRIVRDNAVLKHHRAPLDIEDAAALTSACDISAERAVVDRECPRRPEQSPIQDATGHAAEQGAPCHIPTEGAVRDGQGAVVGDATALVLARDIPANGAFVDRQRATVADGATDYRTIVADGGIDEGQRAAWTVVDAGAIAVGAMPAADSIPRDDAVDDRQSSEAVVDSAAVFLPSPIADGHP